MEVNNETLAIAYAVLNDDKIEIEIPPHDKSIIIEVPETCVKKMAIREIGMSKEERWCK